MGTIHNNTRNKMIQEEQELKNKIEERKSLANRTKIIIKKNKRLLKAKKQLANFKEPVLYLMRRSNHVEFYENATAGKFIFKHSEGDSREFMLDPRYLQTFDYGKERYKGYIIHEDNALPYPQNPLISSEIFTFILMKTAHDTLSHAAKEIKETWAGRKSMILWIGLTIAAVIIAIALAENFSPGTITGLLGKAPKETTNIIIQNITETGRLV